MQKKLRSKRTCRYKKHEMEAMVVSGAPSYTEGKIIDVVKLTDEDGRPTKLMK